MTAPETDVPRWSLTLYVNGASKLSMEAIDTIHRICADELSGDVDLEVVDVNLLPALVVRDNVVATPTLVRRLPAPLRRVVGNLTDSRRVRVSLDLDTADPFAADAREGG